MFAAITRSESRRPKWTPCKSAICNLKSAIAPLFVFVAGGFGAALLLYRRVENPQPFFALFFPHATSVVRARDIVAFDARFQLHGVSGNEHVFFIGERVEIADRKRFDVPLLH